MMNTHDLDTAGTSHSNGGADVLIRIEQILALKIPDTEVPADGAERIKAKFLPVWQKEVRIRARRQHLMVAASFAAAATIIVGVGLVVWFQKVMPAPVDPVANVAKVIGTIAVEGPGGPAYNLTPGDVTGEIARGSWIRTNSDSRVALVLNGGQSLRIDRDTSVFFDSTSAITLNNGAVYLDSGNDSDAGFEVRTAFGVARDIGTQFEVRSSFDNLTVAVREGMVALAGDSSIIEVSKGSRLDIGADGSQRVTSIPADDLGWTWVQEIAPEILIEGKTAFEYLGLIARETGRSLQFFDPETEQHAKTTVLHGTTGDMNPTEGLQFVLMSCGLSVQTTDQTLLIERAGR